MNNDGNIRKINFYWLFICLQFWIKTNYPEKKKTKKTIYEKIEQKIGINLKNVI